MQNLRDKLLNAGLVDKKSKKKADHRARVKRTERKRQKVHEDQLQADRDRAQREREEARRQADRQRERELALAAEREEQQRIAREAAEAQARKAEEQRLIELYRIRELVQASMFLPPRPGPVRFHFVDRTGAIRHLGLSTDLVRDLEQGRRAIAQLPGRERWGLVERDVAERVLAVEPALIRFQAWSSEGELAAAPVPVHEPTEGGKRAGSRTSFGVSSGSDDRRDR